MFPASDSRLSDRAFRVLETRREEAVFSVPENPDRFDDRVRFVIHDDVVLAVDDLRLIDRQAGILADLHFPILIEPTEIAVSVAFRERVAMLDDRLLDVLGQIPRDDPGWWRESEVFKDGNDPRVQVLQLSEGGIDREHDAFALVCLERRSLWSRLLHAVGFIGEKPPRLHIIVDDSR